MVGSESLDCCRNSADRGKVRMGEVGDSDYYRTRYLDRWDRGLPMEWR